MKIHSAYYTYIVQCHDGSFYTGITYDLVKRINQHNGILKGGARYTSTRRPVLLKYFENHPTHKLAAQREYIIKQLPHNEKENLCNSFTHHQTAMSKQD